MGNGDIRVAGSGTVNGGTYAHVKISGSGKVTGNIQAEDVTVSGSGRFLGDVAAAYVTVSGSGRIDGTVTGDVFHTSGSCRIGGKVVVRNMTVDGSCNVAEDVQVERLTSKGSIRVSHDAKVEYFESHGGLHIGGRLLAKRVKIELGGASEVAEIRCEEIECVSGKFYPVNRLFSLALSPFMNKKAKPMTLVTQSIQANMVRLEHAEVDFIQGSTVRIGPKCFVKKVEYRDSITIDPTSTVGEQVRIS